MEVIYVNKSNRHTFLAGNEPIVIALGFFDGVHLGHQQVIKEAKKIADEKRLQLACMSFFPHPKEVLKRDNKKIQYLMPMRAKQRVLKKLGVKKFYIIQFDDEFASLTPEQFVQNHLIDFGVKYAVAGFDFTYGQFGKGNMDRIEEDSNHLIKGIKVEKVEHDGEKISSTLIRKWISTGKMDIVHRYLGQHYQIQGKIHSNKNSVEVVANPYYLLPPPGVYEVSVSNGDNIANQVVLVTQESLRIIFSNRNNSLLMDQQDIYIEWIKRLSAGRFTIVEEKPSLFKEA
ncbi:FAD synthetase family protein [Alteribacillus bidgolensis]|uniref:FAD synthase n=1 Tax=Alteribacillus bidgolensis TaxID=930129 RepID=A0A1G8RY42_9BACI|nr:FAD synthetase family protein [Alteribacillus bidgolensis]SDJ21475.1 riboflavin kinase / FMN adenylyltransferase [Alteribacillus bidgolensis]